MPLLTGIDPGQTGALALLDTDDVHAIVNVWDLPMHALKRGKTKKIRLDLQGFIALVKDLQLFGCVHVYIEKPGGMPNQSAPAAYAFGYDTGQMIGVLAALNMPVTEVPPLTWKKALRVTSDKDDCRLVASQLMPTSSHHWSLKKHDGRAEAALIARYGAQCEFFKNRVA